MGDKEIRIIISQTGKRKINKKTKWVLKLLTKGGTFRVEQSSLKVPFATIQKADVALKLNICTKTSSFKEEPIKTAGIHPYNIHKFIVNTYKTT